MSVRRKIPIRFDGLAALEKEIAENISKGAISFVAEVTYPVGQELELEISLETKPLWQFDVKVLFSSDGFHGCTIQNFTKETLARFCWECEKIKAGLNSDIFSSQPLLKPAAESAPPAQGMTADELLANFTTQARYAADDAAEPSCARAKVAGAAASACPSPAATSPRTKGAEAQVIEAQPLREKPKPSFVLRQACAGKIKNGTQMELFPPLEKVRQALQEGRSLTLPFHHLYLALVGGEMSGLLRLRYTGRSKEFTFFGGAPVSYKAEPRLPKEALPTVLLSLRLLDRQQFLAAYEEHHRTRLPFAEVLLRQRLLTEEQLRYGQEMQTTVLFQDMFEVEEGEYVWIAGQSGAVPSKPLAVRPLGVAFRGLMRVVGRFPTAQLEGLAAQYKACYPRCREGRVDAAALQLEEREEKLWALVAAGQQPLKQVVDCSPLNKMDTWSRLIAWRIVGAVTFEEKASAAAIPIDGELLRQLEAAEGKNHFELLGLHMSAPPYQYAPAVEKKKKEWAALQARCAAHPQLAESVKKYARRLDEAVETISDERRRVQYRQQTFGEGACRFQAETLSKKGHLALFRGDIREAYDCFTSALELNPKNSEAREGLNEARRRGGKPPANK